jgi:hypothetical protein
MRTIVSLWTVVALSNQAPSAPKPIVDNARVTVWDLTLTAGQSGPAAPIERASVRTYVNGGAFTVTPRGGTARAVTHAAGDVRFVPAGTAEREVVQAGAAPARVIVTELKFAAVPPLKNASPFPNAFPRDGAKKVVDNDVVVVWDYTWTPRVPTPMHFHDKDVVVTFLRDGDLKSTTPDGQSVVNENKSGTTRFNARDRVHNEELVNGTQRAVIVELK